MARDMGTANGRENAFQTQTVLRQRLEEAGISPRKKFGQHFLIDRNLMMKLVESAELSESDCVLEVGAGTGSLTALLAGRAGHVVAVEIDRILASLAQEALADYPNVTILNVDALKKKSEVSSDVLTTLLREGVDRNRKVKLVANLPYDIATSLAIDLLLGDVRFERLCFTVQSEVADRFLAQPDTADYGPVGVITQVLSVGSRITKCPPQAFWPRPKVQSTMVRLVPRNAFDVTKTDARGLAGFVRRFFQHRRQMLGRIAKGLPDSQRVLQALRHVGVDAKLRPQNVRVSQWVQLWRLCADEAAGGRYTAASP